MSRKSKRNRAPSPPPQPAPTPAAEVTPSEPAETGPGRTLALSILAVTLLIATVLTVKFIGATPEARERADNERALALASGHAPTLGPDGARVHIVEFLDPACETCATFYPHLKRIMAANPGKIRLSIRHVPFHKGADEAVRVLEGARAQGKYFETLEALLASQDRWTEHHRVMPERIPDAIASVGLDMDRLRGDMNAPEVANRMERDMADTRTLMVSRTPEYFVNGRQMPDFGLEEFRNLVNGELRRAYP